MKKLKKTIALDLGTNIGVAARIIGGKTSFTHFEGVNLSKWDRTKIDLSNIKKPDYRFNNFYNYLNGILEPRSIVYYEQVQAHKGTYAAHIYGGLKAIMIMCCNNYNVPYIGVSVGTIKKHMTGKGNASKKQVMDAVNKKYNQKITDNNITDALALLDYTNKEEL